MNGQASIVPLSRSKRDVSRFLQLSYSIYDGDSHWVAPLLMDLKKVFTDSNPLFKHAEMQLWVATRGGKDVGRIAGVMDRHLDEVMKEPVASFGFFECIEDDAVSGQLFAAVRQWATAKGARRMIGPSNPTTNDECGLLVHGFDSDPVLMMTYNPPYYERLVEQAGYRKTRDLLAYDIDISKIPMDRLTRIAEKLKSRNAKVVLRPVRRKTLDRDLAHVKAVYNSAWEDNWGFVPMTDAEMDFMAERLKPLLMEGLIWLAEVGDEPVGFLLALPDYNIALKPLKGRLLNPNLLKALPFLLQWKRLPVVRVLTLGVKKEYRSKGLETAMLIEGLKVGFKAGVKRAEASWILEENVMMRRVIEAIGGQAYKTYRMYDLPV